MLVTSVHSYFSTISEHIKEYGLTTQSCLRQLENDIERLKLGVWWSDFLTLKVLEKTSTLGVFDNQPIQSSILSNELVHTFKDATAIWQGTHSLLHGEHAYAKAYKHLQNIETHDWSFFSIDVKRASLHHSNLNESLLQLTLVRYVTHLLMTSEPMLETSMLSNLLKYVAVEQSPYISRSILSYPQGRKLAIVEIQTSDYNPLYRGVFHDMRSWPQIDRAALWNAWVSNKANKQSYIWEHLLDLETDYSDEDKNPIVEYQRQSALLLIPEYFERLNIAYNFYGHYLFDTHNSHLNNATLDSFSTTELVF